jgi:peptide deformylase
MKNILKLYGNKSLSTPSEAVTTFSGKTVSLANQLGFLCKRFNGLGIAANQVGRSQSVFMFHHEGTLKAAFNPSIADAEGSSMLNEGCLSFPGMYYDIERPATCLLKAQNAHGESYELELTGVPARCAQHELEHLYGVTMLDMLNDIQLEDFRIKWPRQRSKFLSQQR